MKKLMTVGVAVLAIGLWLIPIRAAAQGHSVGRPEGSPGVGSHAPLGAPGSAAGTTHGSGHDSANGGSNAATKTPGQALAPNSKLSQNLTDLLTKLGVSATPQAVCANFRNLGQCVAAIHVANNLGIDFNKLACDMTLKPVTTSTCPTGTATGSKGISLGASIDALKPGTDSKAELKKANTQTKQDIGQSNS
jgi:hypothetical protein